MFCRNYTKKVLLKSREIRLKYLKVYMECILLYESGIVCKLIS